MCIQLKNTLFSTLETRMSSSKQPLNKDMKNDKNHNTAPKLSIATTTTMVKNGHANHLSVGACILCCWEEYVKKKISYLHAVGTCF